MSKRNKIIILASIITGILIVTLGVTYSMFTYQATSTNSELIAGDIYMHYNEPNPGITLTNMYPTSMYTLNTSEEAVNKCVEYIRNTYGDNWRGMEVGIEGVSNNNQQSVAKFMGAIVRPIAGKYVPTYREYCSNTITHLDYLYLNILNDYQYGVFTEVDKTYFRENNIINSIESLPYFEFTINGKNTSAKDIYYQINLSYGDVVNGKTERIRDDLLKFTLIEYNDGGTRDILTNYSFGDLNNKTIWANRISSGTSEEINRTYRLYMWIDSKTKICSGDITSNCDYYLNQNPNWNDVYASIKVNVEGDFIEKEIHYNVLKNNLLSEMSVPQSIIKEIKFLRLNKEEINTRYQQAPFKSNGVNPMYAGDNIKIWLEEDTENNVIMYIASDEIIYLPYDSSKLFTGFTSMQNIDFSNINTSNVTDMSDMFSDCRSLTGLNLNNFDTSKVTDMGGMFWGCSSLTSLDVSNFDTSNVTDMSDMFSYCTSLTDLNLSSFVTSKVTNMSGMFAECNSLTSLDVSNFDTSKVTNMGGMFFNCNSLTSLDIINFDTSNVTYMNFMFYGCSSLTSLDISNFTFESVKDTSNLFLKMPSSATVTVKSKTEQSYILSLNDRPSAWTNKNVVVKKIN